MPATSFSLNRQAIIRPNVYKNLKMAVHVIQLVNSTARDPIHNHYCSL